MKEKKRRTPRQLDVQFKLSVLKEYYESGCSLMSISRKYSLSNANIRLWERNFASKALPFPSDLSELEARVFMERARKEVQKRARTSPTLSEEDRLRE